MQPDPTISEPLGSGMEHASELARGLSKALCLADMRRVLGLQFSCEGGGLAMLTITRVMTRGEAQEIATLIEKQRFKLVPDGVAHDPLPAESSPGMVAVHPVLRRTELTLPVDPTACAECTLVQRYDSVEPTAICHKRRDCPLQREGERLFPLPSKPGAAAIDGAPQAPRLTPTDRPIEG